LVVVRAVKVFEHRLSPARTMKIGIVRIRSVTSPMLLGTNVAVDTLIASALRFR
jgi:hypothetical protein